MSQDMVYRKPGDDLTPYDLIRRVPLRCVLGTMRRAYGDFFPTAHALFDALSEVDELFGKCFMPASSIERSLEARVQVEEGAINKS